MRYWPAFALAAWTWHLASRMRSRPVQGIEGWRALAVLGILAGSFATVHIDGLPPCGGFVLASHDIPDEYCNRVELQATNSSGSDLTDYPVRFEFPAQNAVAGGFMYAYALDVVPVTSSLTEVELFGQDVDANGAAWWVTFPSIPDGSTVSVYLYAGRNDAHRNQGLSFSGSETVTISSHADFDITDELTILLDLELKDLTARDQTLVERHTGGNGYKLELADVTGTLNLRATVNGATLDVPFSTIGTVDETYNLRMTFDAPTLELFSDGVSVGSTNTGLGSITSASGRDVSIGTSLEDAVIRRVEVHSSVASSPTLVSRCWFDPATSSESTASDPTYTGTVDDLSGNGHDCNYSFNRSQSGISTLTGSFAAISTSENITVPGVELDVLGTGSGQELIDDDGDVNPWIPGVRAVGEACANSGWYDSACYGILYTFGAVVGLLAGVGMFKEIWAGLGLYGTVLFLGSTNGLYDHYYSMGQVGIAVGIVAGRRLVRAGS